MGPNHRQLSLSVMIPERTYLMRIEHPPTYPEGPLIRGCHNYLCNHGYRTEAEPPGSIGRLLVLRIHRVLIHLNLWLLILTLVLMRRIVLLLANGFGVVACLPFISTVQAIGLVPYQYKDYRHGPKATNEEYYPCPLTSTQTSTDIRAPTPGTITTLQYNAPLNDDFTIY